MSNYSDSHIQEDENTTWYKVLNMLKPNSTVMDIGCSSGNFGAELIRRKNNTVDGVEIDKADVEVARQKLRHVYQFNIEEGVPKYVTEHSYDYVYYGDVIEHLVNPVAALINTKKLLKPTGRILFSVPNMGHMLVRLAVLRGEFGYGETGLLDKTHLHFYNKQEVERVFDEAGYKITKLDFVLRDIPRDILEEELRQMGLTGTDDFFKLAQGIDAAAYQIIGEAIVSKRSRKKPLPAVFPAVDEMERHLSKLHQEHAEDIQRVKAHYERLLAERAVPNNQKNPVVRVGKGAIRRIKNLVSKKGMPR
jgi:2-polyprenyl-3-methyl-5-hydroxy-6-metoxy-1,4-benzoquinol methylase